jgi:CelD/BcsL family acetyltransferase involved in cellulose biosynthesis
MQRLVPSSSHQSQLAINTRIVSTDAGFDLLKNEWVKLHVTCPASVFQSFEWLKIWWKHYGSSNSLRSLHIIVVERGAHCIAVAPLFIDSNSSILFGTLRQLHFIGRQDSDYLDFLILPEEREYAYDCLAASLRSSSHLWDAITLEDLPESSITRQALIDRLGSKGWTAEAKVTDDCPQLHLNGSWEEYLQDLDGNFRRDLMRRVRGCEKNFSVEFEVLTDPDEVHEAFDDIVRLHQHRWEHSGEPGVFSREGFVQLQKEAILLLAKRGWVRLVFLRIDGKRVAGNYTFLYRNCFSVYLLGMGDAGEANMYSPGKILHVKSIQFAIDQGCTTYDFLRGVEEIKFQLGGMSHHNWMVTLYPLNSHSRRTQLKRRFHLLTQSASRRLAKERFSFRKKVSQHGFFSRETVKFIVQLPKILFVDGMKKVKDPEKPVYID